MEGLTITGSTPFEKATAGRHKAHLLLVTHLAVKELVQQLEECDKMITSWEDTFKLYTKGQATKDDLESVLQVATQALKDRSLFEAALIQITLAAADDLGLEA